jgi:nitroimidazol reductase NimA-like FMN-containing flavoprotein (pyridoxamine 5'-phosphate oxidase superfamily)
MTSSEPAPPSPPGEPGPPSQRATVRRVRDRASYDRDLAHAIIDEALVCHVGIVTDDGPVVIPTLHARDGDRLLLHGSAASRLLRAGAAGAEMCVTITLIDGLVLARSAFHHSVNYRSVVVFGRAHPIDDLGERGAALDRFVEAIVPGRTADARSPSDKELRATTVLALPLDEVSVKLRTGGAVDEPEDYELPVWAGVVPLTLTPGLPVPDPAMPADTPPTPAYAATYRRRAPVDPVASPPAAPAP